MGLLGRMAVLFPVFKVNSLKNGHKYQMKQVTYLKGVALENRVNVAGGGGGAANFFYLFCFSISY